MLSEQKWEGSERLQYSGKQGLILALCSWYQFNYFGHGTLAYATSEQYIFHVFLSGEKTQVAEAS